MKNKIVNIVLMLLLLLTIFWLWFYYNKSNNITLELNNIIIEKENIIEKDKITLKDKEKKINELIKKFENQSKIVSDLSVEKQWLKRKNINYKDQINYLNNKLLALDDFEFVKNKKDIYEDILYKKKNILDIKKDIKNLLSLYKKRKMVDEYIFFIDLYKKINILYK